MDKHEIIALLNSVGTPVYQIEANLGMPKTTLQKAIKGERKLPKKWAIKLSEAYPKEKAIKIQDLNNRTNEIKPPEIPTNNYTINTIPPMPVKQVGENSLDFAARKNDWKLKYNQ